MPGEPFGVEQRGCHALIGKFRPDGGEQGRVARKRQGESFIIFQGSGDEFGKASGLEDTCAHASGECRSETGHERHTGPQRVTGRAVGVIVQRVEKQVGLAYLRSMINPAFLCGLDGDFESYPELKGWLGKAQALGVGGLTGFLR